MTGPDDDLYALSMTARYFSDSASFAPTAAEVELTAVGKVTIERDLLKS